MSDNRANEENTLKEVSPIYRTAACEPERADIDVSLLQESLRLTPWERMLANDDALNFAESLRAAMKKRNAES